MASNAQTKQRHLLSRCSSESSAKQFNSIDVHVKVRTVRPPRILSTRYGGRIRQLRRTQRENVGVRLPAKRRHHLLVGVSSSLSRVDFLSHNRVLDPNLQLLISSVRAVDSVKLHRVLITTAGDCRTYPLETLQYGDL